MKSEINLKQIAYLSGYSKSTVSKALNDSPEISELARSKIKKIADDYNYKPNYSAKSLKLKKASTIGLIVPEFSNLHCAKIMEGVSDEAIKRGCKLVVHQSQNKLSVKNKIVNLLFDGSVDGLIIVTDDRFAEKCEKAFVQKVMDSGLPSVKMDFSIFLERHASPLVTKTIGQEITIDLFNML